MHRILIVSDEEFPRDVIRLSPADLQEKVPREFFINDSKEAALGQELRMVGCREGGEYLMGGLGRSLIHISLYHSLSQKASPMAHRGAARRRRRALFFLTA